MTTENRDLGFRELLRADARACDIRRISPALCIASAIGLSKFSLILLFRVASELHGKGAIGGFISALATRLNTLYNSSEMSPLARIGPGLHVPHTAGVGFGPIRAGSNLTLLHHSSLGLRDRDVDHDNPANYPKLGNNVLVGPGAVILGPVYIGDGATISANAVVLQDMPAGSLAIGNPAKIVKRPMSFHRNGVIDDGALPTALPSYANQNGDLPMSQH